jgi:hypothetical protein
MGEHEEWERLKRGQNHAGGPEKVVCEIRINCGFIKRNIFL